MIIREYRGFTITADDRQPGWFTAWEDEDGDGRALREGHVFHFQMPDAVERLCRRIDEYRDDETRGGMGARLGIGERVAQHFDPEKDVP